jgi:hypothetical protein
MVEPYVLPPWAGSFINVLWLLAPFITNGCFHAITTNSFVGFFVDNCYSIPFASFLIWSKSDGSDKLNKASVSRKGQGGIVR